MESKDTQGIQLFEATADGDWSNPHQPVCSPELNEIIRRIYDEKLTDETIAPKMKYELIRLLLPDCPRQVIANAKKNQSSLKPTNLQFHLLKLVPQLFIAALHYRNYDRAQHTEDMMEQFSKARQQLYKERHKRVYTNRFD